MSTSLKASSSAISKKMASRFLGGFGVYLFVGGMLPKVTGFGNLPLLPHLRLLRYTFPVSFVGCFVFGACGLYVMQYFYIFLCIFTYL
jgi:hypothetical protein